MRQYINWKFYLVTAALCIVAATLYYTNQLAKKLADEETKKIEQVVLGIKTLNNAQVSTQDLTFISKFIEENTTIPLIITTEKGEITDFRNIDTSRASNGKKLLKDKLIEFRSM